MCMPAPTDQLFLFIFFMQVLSMRVCVCARCTVLCGQPDTDEARASDALATASDGLVWNK